MTFVVNRVCQHFQTPQLNHFKEVKRILWYLKGTLDHGISFLSQITPTLSGFCDADWVGCKLTKSTTSFSIFLGANDILWSSKKQATIARSSVEYHVLASITIKITWITYLLKDIDIKLSTPPQLFSNNLSPLHMSQNLVFHACTKHIKLYYHFVREKVVLGSLFTWSLPSYLQIVDVSTKPLSPQSFLAFKFKLGVHPISCLDLREVDKESGMETIKSSKKSIGQEIFK